MVGPHRLVGVPHRLGEEFCHTGWEGGLEMQPGKGLKTQKPTGVATQAGGKFATQALGATQAGGKICHTGLGVPHRRRKGRKSRSELNATQALFIVEFCSYPVRMLKIQFHHFFWKGS